MWKPILIFIVMGLVMPNGTAHNPKPYTDEVNAKLSDAAAEFQDRCIASGEDCLYENVAFISPRKLLLERHYYIMIKTLLDLQKYKILVNLKSNNEYRILYNASAKYDRSSNSWNVVVNDAILAQHLEREINDNGFNHELLRIDIKQMIKPQEFGYISLSNVVYKNEKSKNEIIISAPSVLNRHDKSSIYIESRIHGQHDLTSINSGGVIINLDGSGVPDALPDYVSASPMASWSEVASKYRAFESKASVDVDALPARRRGSLQEQLTWVFDKIRSYKIRYAADARGSFPSITPAEVISSRVGDCKALATLAIALLKRSGVRAVPVLLNASARPPLSFVVPGNFWGTAHVILYVPAAQLYVDPSRVVGFGADWRTSASSYRGAVALNLATGHFVVIQ